MIFKKPQTVFRKCRRKLPRKEKEIEGKKRVKRGAEEGGRN